MAGAAVTWGAGIRRSDQTDVLATRASLVFTVLWVVGLLLLQRAGRWLPWQETGHAPHGEEHPRGHSRQRKEQQATTKGTSTVEAALVFGIAALLTLVAGVVLEESGDAIARMGADSLAGLGLSALGVAGLVAIARS